MRLGTVLSLGASALLGLGALFVAQVVLPGGKAPAPGVQQPAGTPVVVAAVPLAYGVKLEAKHLVVAQYPAGSAPEGAFTSVEQLLGREGGPPVVLAPMAPREPLLPAKLTGPGQRPTIAALISDHMRAYTVRVSDVAAVGGHALPGDHVDVLLMRDLSDEGEQRYVTDVVLQNVRLLGMDLNADPTSSTPAAPRTATLEVTPEDAQKLSMASDLGTLSLTLRPAGAAEIEIMRPLPATELGIVGQPRRRSSAAAAAPAAPAPAGHAPTAPAPRRAFAGASGVIVTHGDSRTLVEVPADRGV